MVGGFSGSVRDRRSSRGKRREWDEVIGFTGGGVRRENMRLL